ncbi:uncharacterized protein B0H64DRAFT_412364 [Chaetomium fimeti]|uniref:Uncharacterized protein n=1 Tax=Chaetomium fimeti TaxID=1854472 RepID=A0AAE0H5T3_9PEZI|nr:hypothetical protein B0H64DRAFT_412364 [Chaetomium fimeti]
MDLQSATAAELHRFLEASLRGTIWASRATLRTAQRVHAAVNGPASNLTGWEAGLCASLDEARRMGRLALDGAHLIHVALTRDPPPVDDGWEIIDDHHSSSEDEPTEINDGWDDNGALFDDEPLATGYTLAGGGSDGDSASDTDRPPSHHRVPSAPTPPQHNLHLPRDPPPSPPTPPQPIHQNPSTRTPNRPNPRQSNARPRSGQRRANHPQPPTPPPSRHPAHQHERPLASPSPVAAAAAADKARTTRPTSAPC